MKKAIYHISGFDCPNCAAKVERHLNKDENISEATLDFANDRLYVNYREEPYSLEQLKAKIKEVESDPLRVEQLNKGTKEKQTIFTKKFIFNLSRIIVAGLILLIAFLLGQSFAFNNDFNAASITLLILAAVILLYDIVWKVIQNIIHLRNPVDMNLLLTISCIGVFVLSFLIENKVLTASFEIDMFDGALVVLLYQVGELIEAEIGRASCRERV